jgi:hypothetical protein
MINLSVKHGQSLEVARTQLDKAVQDVRATLGPLVQRIEWTDDHRTVTLHGAGFNVSMWVDEREVHATGELAFLGGLLSSPLVSGLKGILQKAFPKQITS